MANIGTYGAVATLKSCSKKDQFEEENVNVNLYKIEATIIFNLKDEDLSLMSDLKVHSILNNMFSEFSIIKDYKELSRTTFEKKYIYNNRYQNVSFVYFDGNDYYVKNDERFLKVDLIKVNDEIYVKDFNLYKCVEFNEENYLKFRETEESRWCAEPCNPSNFRNILSKPLDNEP